MTRSSAPPVEPDVIKGSSFNSSIIYISIIICVILIGAFFMYKVYKKLQTINQDIIAITEKGDSLDSSKKDTDRQIDMVVENLKQYRIDALAQKQRVAVANMHEELPLNDYIEEKGPLEDITEETN